MLEKYIGRKVSLKIRATKEEVSGTVMDYKDNFLIVDQITRYGHKREILVHKDDICYLLLR
ncbi:MAG: hypothetical protein H0Z28_12750 [Archaeoglobus sp.]|nr:hypothetical protein [Archaeoglobus sp.]